MLENIEKSLSMIKKKFNLLLLLLLLLSIAGVASAGSNIRCGHNLVELGDHKIHVYDLCGVPESIDSHTKIIGNTLHHPRRTLDIQQYEEIEVEEWIYDFGSKRFRQYLRFENGRLVEIKDLKKGRR